MFAGIQNGSLNEIVPTLTIATAIVFLLTYAGIALGRIPGFRLDRAGIALTGAALMMAIGAITPDEAYRAVNLDTLALLLGMMIVVAHLRLSGFFRLVTSWALTHARSPLILLATVAVTAGAFSAFLVNDAVCLVMTPLVIEVTRSLRRDPVPYLLAVAMASNVGSVATITGNPQNIIVGVVSRIPYVEFAAALVPLAAVGLVVVIVVLATLWWREFRLAVKLTAKPPAARGAQGAAHQSGSGDARGDRRLLRRRASGDGSLSRGRLVAGDPRDQSAQGLSGDRRLALVDVCRSVCRSRGSGENPVDARGNRIGAGLSLREYLRSHVRYRGAFQRYQQCAGGVSAQAVRARPSRPASHLARDCDERDASGQSHPGWVGRQSHCRRTRPRRWHPPLVVGLLPRRNSDHLGHPRAWRVVAELIGVANALIDLAPG